MVGISGIKIYLDDIIIRGKDKEEHNDRLFRVLEKLEKTEVSVEKKCDIGKLETFLGYRLAADGVRSTEERIKAVKEAPRSTNKQEL